jgi:hypothetical protein
MKCRPGIFPTVASPAHYRIAFLACHASADADQKIRIGQFQVSHTSQVVKNLFLGFLPNRAGIEKDQVGIFRPVDRLISLRCMENIRHLVGVVLVHLTSESPYKNLFGHD